MMDVQSAGPDDLATFDLIVIGAGINGAGIARDAAIRGLRVLLLDKGDVAGGTSSWSTRLIHGGLRYLEHGEIHLVRESLRERERLLRNAPHLVKPLPLFIPLYSFDKRAPWMVRAGMIAYDLLSMDKSLDSHTMLSKKAALARVSRLNPEGLKGAALYYDAQVEYAERLVLENVLSARNHGATVQTYHRVDKLVRAGDVVVGVEYTDVLTGRTGAARSTVIINVAGPWVDDVLANSRSSKDETVRMIGGTKGSHIVVRPFAGAPQNALYVEALQDHRPYFIIPWNNLYLIGTTDVPFEGDPNNARADEAEIQYLIDETNRVLPSAELDRASVLYTYSGVRPLPYQPNGRGDDSPTAGAITRRHIVHDHAPGVEGLISIVGGKLTTYRSLAEQAVDMVYRKLDRPSPPSRTASLSLPGGGAFAAADFRALGVSPETLRRLGRIYGSRTGDLLALTEREPDLSLPLGETGGAIRAEIVYAFRSELARTLADALLRRTMLGFGPQVGLDVLDPAADVAQRYLGWECARVEHEKAIYRKYVERFTPATTIASLRP